MRIAAGKENDMKELQERIRKLLYDDSNLRSLVLECNRSKNGLDTNETKNVYFNEIDTLYRNTFQEGQSLNEKGKCKLCPPKGILNYF
jgi:hypothetical protein